jgi:hypothetical protein
MKPEEFNEKYPIGTVVLHKSSGVMTRTSSEAGMEEGKAWVNLCGFAWSVELDEVEVWEDRTHLVCQRCGEPSILEVDFESYPGFDTLPGSIRLDANAEREVSDIRDMDPGLPFLRPHPLAADGAEGIKFLLCTHCGQMQGKWPLDVSGLEPEHDEA